MGKTNSRLTKAGLGVTAAGALAVAVIGSNEGLRLYAYRDVVNVWTACYGETKGIKPGMKFTKAQCDIMFIGSLTEHEVGMRACLNHPDAIPEKVYVAELDLAYNIGIGAFCKSTARKLLNLGNWRGACNAIAMYNKAGGRVIKGLVDRRARVVKLCLSDLPK